MEKMKDKLYRLECCVDSVESALNAEKGGADRFELCGNLIIGGTTPDLALFRTIRKYTNKRIHVLIRPRFGDFLYSEYEMETMRQSIEIFREEGADGIVIGCLTEDGRLNLKEMEQLVRLAGDLRVVLHRAFDVCQDPLRTLQEAIDLGIQIILTSGQRCQCYDGRQLLNELVTAGQNKIEIMAGAGVNAETIKKLLVETPIKSFHMSGKVVQESKMRYRKDDINMGLPMLSEYEIWRTGYQEILNAKNAIRAHIRSINE